MDDSQSSAGHARIECLAISGRCLGTPSRRCRDSYFKCRGEWSQNFVLFVCLFVCLFVRSYIHDFLQRLRHMVRGKRSRCTTLFNYSASRNFHWFRCSSQDSKEGSKIGAVGINQEVEVELLVVVVVVVVFIAAGEPAAWGCPHRGHSHRAGWPPCHCHARWRVDAWAATRWGVLREEQWPNPWFCAVYKGIILPKLYFFLKKYTMK